MKFSKSLKIGPTRLNFSKKGIGVSTGVKGLRIGVNAQGKTYVSGGVKRLRFRQNLSSKKKNSSTITANNIGEKELFTESTDKYSQSTILTLKELKDLKLPTSNSCLLISLLVISLIGLFSEHPVFIISTLILSIWLIIVSIMSFGKTPKKLKSYSSEIDSLIKNNDIENLEIKIENLKLKWKGRYNEKYFKYVLLNSYSTMIPAISADMKIDNYEKQIIDIYKKYLSKEEIYEINSYFLNGFIIDFTSDQYLDKVEENFLTQYMDTFEIPDSEKAKYINIIKRYIDIRNIQDNDLELINPSLQNITESNKCYYEAPIRILKMKIIKRFSENGIKHKINSFVLEKEGKLFITENTIQLFTTGHQTLKLEKVINIEVNEIDSEIIEIYLQNRKSAIYISTPDVIKTLIILKKIFMQKNNMPSS